MRTAWKDTAANVEFRCQFTDNYSIVIFWNEGITMFYRLVLDLRVWVLVSANVKVGYFL